MFDVWMLGVGEAKWDIVVICGYISVGKWWIVRYIVRIVYGISEFERLKWLNKL